MKRVVLVEDQVAVRELLESFFDGSPEKLMTFLGAPVMAAAAAAGDAEEAVHIDPVLL